MQLKNSKLLMLSTCLEP